MNETREVVLLHGWGMTARVWREFAALLAPLDVCAPGLPGYGSVPDCTPCTLAAAAAAVSRAAPRRCTVVGWSLGGLVALAWARAAPEQLVRLVLIATTPSFAARPGWSLGLSDATLAQFAAELAADRNGTLRRFTALQVRDEVNARGVMQRLRAAVAGDDETSGRALASGLQMLREADLRESLGAVRQPVLLVQGDRDGLVPPAAARALAERLPDARLLMVAGAGHAPFLSRPGETAAAVREFLDG